MTCETDVPEEEWGCSLTQTFRRRTFGRSPQMKSVFVWRYRLKTLAVFAEWGCGEGIEKKHFTRKIDVDYGNV
jgi:hypothetical protein